MKPTTEFQHDFNPESVNPMPRKTAKPTSAYQPMKSRITLLEAKLILSSLKLQTISQ